VSLYADGTRSEANSPARWGESGCRREARACRGQDPGCTAAPIPPPHAPCERPCMARLLWPDDHEWIDLRREKRKEEAAAPEETAASHSSDEPDASSVPGS